jgi:hypothetical protein
MKKIIIILTTILLSTTIANAEVKKSKGDCIAEHKISPAALGCSIKKLFKNKDGSPNSIAKFYNAKSAADLSNKGKSDKVKKGAGALKKKIKQILHID